MGQEISDSHFQAEDFDAFRQRLQDETRLLQQWFDDGMFPRGEHVVGFELEAWVVDQAARPAPINEALLQRLADPLVVPELARFNLEFNGTPQRLSGAAFSLLADELQHTWGRCNRLAGEWNARLAMIGILPTVVEGDLNPGNMSSMLRYLALDEQLRLLRDGTPVQVDINGRDRLRFSHKDVMLESATTSFQIHLKVDADRAGRFYNAAKVASAAMVAVSANSPYLFGAELWEETRIPLFEQAVPVIGGERVKRVTLGTGYVDSIIDCFAANLNNHPVLLPELMEDSGEQLLHLRLHNGTIWRWNRPLIGFDRLNRPHIRIEHRVVPAGPTVVDSVANAAFFVGLVCALANLPEPPEKRLPYAQARENFYRAAHYGLAAEIRWLDGRRVGLKRLIRDELLGLARTGLAKLAIDPEESGYWLGIIAERVRTGQNGASWQRAWVRCHGVDMAALTESYLERQESLSAVHEWTL
ncbi:MAG: glutamate--cysteine ligase [Gammaproteobacteria bacterium]|nr:glutamate--cysteine ligase [Gammaproteobacteria bacterium]